MAQFHLDDFPNVQNMDYEPFDAMRHFGQYFHRKDLSSLCMSSGSKTVIGFSLKAAGLRKDPTVELQIVIFQLEYFEMLF